MTAAMNRRSFRAGSVSQAHRDVTDEKYRDLRRPRKVRFYCNGDRFFKGKRLYVTPHRYVTFNDLLNDLTGKLPGNVHLPYGVRQIYTPVGGHKVRDIEDLQDGQNYVCAGFESFRSIQYGKADVERWSIDHQYLGDLDPLRGHRRTGGKPPNHDFLQNSSSDFRYSGARGYPGAFQPGRALRNTYPGNRANHAGNFGPRPQASKYWGNRPAPENTVSKPKVVTVLRGGPHPKGDIKILLNRRSVQSYEQLVKDISEAFGPKWKNNKVRKLYSLKGREVQGISDFFREDEIFIATGNETLSLGDVQELLEDVYPDSPYSKNLLREWERAQKKQKKREGFDEESKRDSGLGSDESNRDEGDKDEIIYKGRHPDQSRGKKKKDKYVFATDEDIVLRLEHERARAGNEEREKARRRMQKRMEAEKRALDEERRKRGLVPLKPVHDPFKRMQEEREKERKRRAVEEQEQRNAEAEAIREKLRAQHQRQEQEKARALPSVSPQVIMVVKAPAGYEADVESHGEKDRDKSTPVPDRESRNMSRRSELRKSPTKSPYHSPIKSPDKSPAKSPDKSLAKSPEKSLSRSPVKSPAKSPSKSPTKSPTGEEASRKGEPVNSPAKLSTIPDENANVDSENAKSTKDEPTIMDDKDGEPAADEGTPGEPQGEDATVISKDTSKLSDKKKGIITKTKTERQISNMDHVLSKYEPGKVLGDGNFAVVKQCTLRSIGTEYAMKVIDKSKLKGKEHMIENEIAIMKICEHPNIVKLVEEFETKDEIYLIMELVKGGDLFDAITQSVKFGEGVAASMIRDLANALFYLHSQHVVHRDLKPENLMVCRNKDGTVTLKLADFGLTMEVKEPIFTVCGTPTYVAPEILSEIGYGLEVDMWALGVISYILLCGFPPFRSPDRKQTELFEFIKAGQYEYLSPYWDNISKGAKDLISRLLIVDKQKRYQAADVLTHPWIITLGGSVRAPTNMDEHRNNLRRDLDLQAKENREAFLKVQPR